MMWCTPSAGNDVETAPLSSRMRPRSHGLAVADDVRDSLVADDPRKLCVHILLLAGAGVAGPIKVARSA